jgi:hypothetical protein
MMILKGSSPFLTVLKPDCTFKILILCPVVL